MNEMRKLMEAVEQLHESFQGQTYDAILDGSEATEEGALDYARGMVWSEVGTTENNIKYANHIGTENGVDVFYDFGADYYFFAPAELEEGGDILDEGWPQEETYDEMVEYWKGSLSRSIVSKGVFTQMYDAAGQDIDVLNAAIEDEAHSIAERYHGSGEGIGTSDQNHFIASIARQLGIDDVFGWRKPKEGIEEEDHYRSHHPKYKGDDWSKDDHGQFLDKMEKRGLKKATRGSLKSDEEMERDKANRYAKFAKAIRGRKGLSEDDAKQEFLDKLKGVPKEPLYVGFDQSQDIEYALKKYMPDPDYEIHGYDHADRPNLIKVTVGDYADNTQDLMYDKDLKKIVDPLDKDFDAWMDQNPFESLEEAKGNVVKVPFKIRADSSRDVTAFGTSEQAEEFIKALGIDDQVSHDVIDPETGELLFTKNTTKRQEIKKGNHQILTPNDFSAGARLSSRAKGDSEPLAPVMHGGWDADDFEKQQDDAWEMLNKLRDNDFYNVVWKNAAELVGSPADLGAEGDDWGDLDYDVDMEVPVAIKRKDGKRFDDDDHDNFREIVKAVKKASTMGNFGISYAGTSNKGTVARFVPSFM